MNHCASCMYWERQNVPREEHGLCRRRAPTPGEHGGARWPETHQSLGCGDWGGEQANEVRYRVWSGLKLRADAKVKKE